MLQIITSSTTIYNTHLNESIPNLTMEHPGSSSSYRTIVALLYIHVLVSSNLSCAFIVNDRASITYQHVTSNTKLSSYRLPNDLQQNRRNFLSESLVSSVVGGGIVNTIFTTSLASPALAAGDGEDLTSQMFNEDGSLKANSVNGLSGSDIEAKSKTVIAMFPSSTSSDSAVVNVDGNFKTQDGISSESQLVASYQIPEKWTPAPEYIDTLLSVGEKACDHITVYQAPGTYKDDSMLDKATTIGVSKALNFDSTGPDVFPKALKAADIVSGRKVTKEFSLGDGKKNQKYYEFDLAVAPDICGQSAENLNLGFCPYDTIVLISATIVNEKLMVCTVTCNKDMWKRANADLKRVRGSFLVQAKI